MHRTWAVAEKNDWQFSNPRIDTELLGLVVALRPGSIGLLPKTPAAMVCLSGHFLHTAPYCCNLMYEINMIAIIITSKEPVCPRVELIFKIITILLIIFLGFIKSKPC